MLSLIIIIIITVIIILYIRGESVMSHEIFQIFHNILRGKRKRVSTPTHSHTGDINNFYSII